MSTSSPPSTAAAASRQAKKQDDAAEVYANMNELAFNVRPPTTAWLNMGWWDSEDTHFVDACEELARRLHSSVKLPANPAILDVGCGSGDSCLLLQRTYAPRILHGATSLPAHASFARNRLRTQAPSESAHDVHCADAVQWLQNPRAALVADGPHTDGYDAIFALDCAYHFSDRPTFFQHAFNALRPGGSVGLVDLALAYPYPTPEQAVERAYEFTPSESIPPPTRAPTRLENALHYLSCAAASSPTSRFVCVDTYAAQLRTAGFPASSIHITDISAAVLPGFERFLRSVGDQGGGKGGQQKWRASPPALMTFGLNMVGKHVVSKWAAGGDSGMLRCVLVTATKAGDGSVESASSS